MMSLQSETSIGNALSYETLKHIIPSPNSGATARVGRARLTVDDEMREELDTEEDEERADGIAENEKSSIDVKAICSACIIV